MCLSPDVVVYGLEGSNCLYGVCAYCVRLDSDIDFGLFQMRCPAFTDSNHHPARYASMSTPYCSRPGGRWGQMHLVNGAGVGGKLDSRFVEDVTIKDGTEMAPGTRFTKVWRLRNSGKIPWGPNTKLVHVGGDELGSVLVVPLEVS
jgi:hypothetical protein